MSERRLFLRSIKSHRERYEVRGDAGAAFDFDTISEGVQIERILLLIILCKSCRICVKKGVIPAWFFS